MFRSSQKDVMVVRIVWTDNAKRDNFGKRMIMANCVK